MVVGKRFSCCVWCSIFASATWYVRVHSPLCISTTLYHTVVYASSSNTDFVHRSDPSQKRFLPCFDRCGTCKQRLYVLVDCSFLAICTLLLIRPWAEMYLQIALWKQAEKDSRVDDEMDADFAHLIWGNLARWKRWKHCSFLRQGSNCWSEVITEPECRSGLRKESTIFAEAGEGPGVGFLNEIRTRSRSENFSFDRSRIINFFNLKFSLNG